MMGQKYIPCGKLFPCITQLTVKNLGGISALLRIIYKRLKRKSRKIFITNFL